MGVLDLRRPVTLQIVAFLEQLTGWAKHRARIKLKVVLLQKLESCPLHSKKTLYIYTYLFLAISPQFNIILSLVPRIEKGCNLFSMSFCIHEKKQLNQIKHNINWTKKVPR